MLNHAFLITFDVVNQIKLEERLKEINGMNTMKVSYIYS